MLKRLKSLLALSTERRERNQAIHKKVWDEYCGQRGRVACTVMLCLRYIIFLMIGVFASLGFLLTILPGTLHSLAMPFYFLWNRAPHLIPLLPLFAFWACMSHLYARACFRMVNASLGENQNRGA